jgi:hypothetical protein
MALPHGVGSGGNALTHVASGGAGAACISGAASVHEDGTAISCVSPGEESPAISSAEQLADGTQLVSTGPSA